MKKIILPLLALALVLSCCFVFPVQAGAEAEELYQYYVSDGGAIITGCNGTIAGNVVIPDTLGGYPVIGIDDRAFDYCAELTALTLPTTLRTIGANAFANCTQLTGVAIPDSVTAIYDWAFEGCTSLSALTVGKGVTSLGNGVFHRCTALKQVTLPDSVEYTGYGTFEGCTALTAVTLPKGIWSVENGTFRDCTALAEVTLPDGVQYLGYGAFENCTSLTSITIPQNVSTIQDDTFLGCTGLTGFVVSENNTNYCNDDQGILYDKDMYALIRVPAAFSGSYTAPAGLRRISMYAFADCTGLTEAVLANDVTYIENYAFYNCSTLASVTIGKNVTSIGDYAFYGCTALADFNVEKDNSKFSSDERGVLYNKEMTKLLKAPAALSGSYTIPDGVKKIISTAFDGCTALTEVILPESMGSLDYRTFADCKDLQFSAYGNAKYLGTATNPYFALIDATASNITTCTVHQDTKIVASGAMRECYSLQYNVHDNAKYLGTEDNPYFLLMQAAKYNITSCAVHPDAKLIAANAFQSCSSMTSVTLPEGLLFIGDYAFAWCYQLPSVVIPNSVTFIGEHAFAYCEALSSATISESVTEIAYRTFAYCTSLEEIEVPQKVSVIDEAAFINCQKMSNVTIPRSVTSILADAFNYCGNLKDVYYGSTQFKWYRIEIGYNNYALRNANIHFTEPATSIEDYLAYTVNNGKATITKCDWAITGDAVIPDTLGGYPVVALGDNAFENCVSLNSITLPDSVQSVGYRALWGCDSMTGIFVSENNPYLSSDEKGVLFNKDKTLLIQAPGALTGSYAIPQGVKEIGASAFEYCRQLTELTIPEGVQTIGDRAFTACTKLPVLNLPQSLQTIGEQAFSSCNVLTGIWVPEGNTNFCNDDKGVLYNKDKSVLLQVPGGIVGSYTVAEGVQTIGNAAFSGCYQVTSVTIPDGVRIIGKDAFQYCEALKEISIPNSVTTLGQAAFAGCGNLEQVTIPGSITTIAEETFAWCSSLSAVTMENGVQSIGRSAFNQCENLKSVTIPDSVKTIDEMAFSYCRSLTSVTLPEDLETLGNNAFAGTALKSVTIPDSVTSLGYGVFSECASLTEATIGNGAKFVPESLFGRCVALKTIYIADGVERIQNWAFGGCPALTAVRIPASVTYIGYSAFESCNALKDVYYTGTEAQWSEIEIGWGCEPLKAATVHFETEMPMGTKGDLDGIEGVSVDDAIYLLQHVLMPELFPVDQTADFNSDGQTNVDDAIYLLQHVLMPELFPL